MAMKIPVRWEIAAILGGLLAIVAVVLGVTLFDRASEPFDGRFVGNLRRVYDRALAFHGLAVDPATPSGKLDAAHGSLRAAIHEFRSDVRAEEEKKLIREISPCLEAVDKYTAMAAEAHKDIRFNRETKDSVDEELLNRFEGSLTRAAFTLEEIQSVTVIYFQGSR